MNELISTFHIDWKIMLAQLFNFALVFLALYFIAAKPLRKMMDDREDEIKTGLTDAENAKAELAGASLKKEEITREAKDNAKNIISQSQADGRDIVKEAKDKATLEKEEILKQARLDVEKEKKTGDEAIRKEAAELVSVGVRKMVEGYVAAGKGDEIINAMLAKK
ncbi:MAG: F0F1 ATP synthase subunit B [Minisyncoccia bacterium]